jgi:hypothetical protein
MMRKKEMAVSRSFLVSLVLVAAWPLAAVSGEPVAIVEDLSGDAGSLQVMDYVEEGRVIKLGGGAVLTLGYFESCAQEVITGGVVTVGSKQSRVDGGRLERRQVECDGGKLQLTEAQGKESGLMVFRKGTKKTGALPKPERTLYGSSPVIVAPSKNAGVTISRLDRPETEIEQMAQGGVVDLASAGLRLSPGGIYQVESDGHVVVFKIDAFAEPGMTPLVSRLIRMQ